MTVAHGAGRGVAVRHDGARDIAQTRALAAGIGGRVADVLQLISDLARR